MTLKLQVTSHQHQFMGDDAEQDLTRGGSIGRGTQNDWVLPDPARVISSNHAAIVPQDAGYSVVDNSTNGTLLNDRRLPQGIPQPLADGDRIAIGEYELTVSLDTADAALSTPAPIEPVGPEAPAAPESFFESGPDLAPAADLLAPQAPTPALGSTPESLDPLDLFGDPDALSPSGQTANPPVAGPPQPDIAEPGEHSFDLPVMQPDPLSQAADSGAIPENWMDELDEASALSSEPDTEDIPLPSESLPASSADDPFFAPPAAQPTDAPPVPPASSASYRAGEPASGDLDSLLRSAGVDPAALAPDSAAVIGQCLKIMVQGLVDVLRARSDIKNQFRVPVTTLKSADNNPLKVAITAEDALRILFSGEKGAYLPPVQAFSEGIQDIKNHQIAMLMGMQVGFDAMLERFDPDRLESSFDKGLKRGKLLDVVNKTKYWELYRDMFAELGTDEEAFRRCFGDVFAEAYEEQMQRLGKRSKD